MSYLRKCFLTQKKEMFAFRGPVKYFEFAPVELGRSGDGKRSPALLYIYIRTLTVVAGALEVAGFMDEPMSLGALFSTDSLFY